MLTAVCGCVISFNQSESSKISMCKKNAIKKNKKKQIKHSTGL